MTPAADPVGDTLRERDRDCYLASLFVAPDKRPGFVALHAFAEEVAAIPLIVSEPQIGLIRLQWWHDTLAALATGEASPHPLAASLGQAIATYRLPIDALHDLVSAHEADLQGAALDDVTALESYLGRTHSARIQLASLILAGSAATASAKAAGLAGVAWGMIRLLRGKRAGLLPRTMSAADAADLATQRLAEARALSHTLAQGVLPAFLPAGLSDLDRASPLRRQLALWWRARRNRF